MKVTEVKRKESTKHCCGNGCLWRDSAEHEEETEALIDKRIAQNNAADADRQASGLLEEIVSRGNLNRAYVVNNLSDFIFGLIRAIGMILLGFGIVQVGLSLKSHDPSQRANGFLTLAGGVIITFAKEILTLITG